MSGSTYYVPEQSKWPILASIALGLLAYGAAMTLTSMSADRDSVGPWILGAGFLVLFYVIFGWFKDQIQEEAQGLHSDQLDGSYRQGMLWFIFSDVMFFAAFFGALFYPRYMVVLWLGGESNNFFTNLLLWEGYESTWPTNGPGNIGGEYQTMGPFGLPLINTAILLTSSITVTIAHHALIAGKRPQLATFLAATFLLGFVFVYLQGVEY